jgi:hypothetical protein
MIESSIAILAERLSCSSCLRTSIVYKMNPGRCESVSVTGRLVTADDPLKLKDKLQVSETTVSGDKLQVSEEQETTVSGEFVIGIEESPCLVRRLMLPMRVEANEGPSTFVFSSSRATVTLFAVRINTVLILPALPQDD